MTPVLLAHVGATLAMGGLIWFVQVVHYPLLGRVGTEHFTDYHADHRRLTGSVVIPIMSLEMATGVWLVVQPGSLSAALVWLGFGLLCIVWTATATLQVPQHRVLARGFDADVHRRLVRTNWVRTVGWTARGVLVLSIAGTVLT